MMYHPSALAVTATARAMLQAPDVMPPPPDAPQPNTENTLQLRIIALFVILIAGFGGGMLPQAVKVHGWVRCKTSHGYQRFILRLSSALPCDRCSRTQATLRR